MSDGLTGSLPRLAISTGDPGGIGPLISVLAAKRYAKIASCVLFGQRSQLSSLLRDHGVHQVEFVAVGETNTLLLEPGVVGVVDTSVEPGVAIGAHEPTAEGGRVQLAALEAARSFVERGLCQALVTAPISKQAVTLSGLAFVGHTEYLAQKAGLCSDDVTMIFCGPRLVVSLVTTHLPIRELDVQITAERVTRAGQHLVDFLRERRRRSHELSIAVCGLNPHAGEGGVLGDEEQRLITPAVQALASTTADTRWMGPVGAETAFRWAASNAVDGVVAQFHDQATIASKLLDWGQAVNVTWGLPYLRVSVDHGVAYDAAASGTVDASAMYAAMQLAIDLV